MKASAGTVEEYLASLPPERQSALRAVRDVIKKNLPEGFEEGMQYGMIGYYVPLSRYPVTYNGQALGIAALASQKSYMVVYLMCVYGDPATRAWFEREYRATGKRLDMGKSCVLFRTKDDLPLDLVGQAISRVSVETYIARYESVKGKPTEKQVEAALKKLAQPPAKKASKPAAKKASKPAAKKASKPVAKIR